MARPCALGLAAALVLAGPAAGIERRTLVVPRDYGTIQEAVDEAEPGDTVLIKPGVYHESVIVSSPGITIAGVDRFRTVLHGRDRLNNGISVQSASGVKVLNLTVRNYTANGVFFNDSDGYEMARIDSIKNRVYGLYAFDSYRGVIRDSFAWGSGDAGIYIGQCFDCRALITSVHAERNHFGYSGTNATGVTIEDSVWVRNGVGLFPNTLPYESEGPNRGTVIRGNLIASNNYDTVPAAGFTTIFGAPFGSGIWLYGVQNNVVEGNTLRDHERYGVVLSHAVESASAPVMNRVVDNSFSGSGMYPIAWDGSGYGNCFAGNELDAETGPPALQTLYACGTPVPLPGVPFAPVAADVLVATYLGPQTRRQDDDVPEPRRPRCQRGAPGCHRP